MEATQQNENKLNVDHQTKQNTIPNMRACVCGLYCIYNNHQVCCACMSINLATYLSVCLFVCLSVCLFVCLSVRVSVLLWNKLIKPKSPNLFRGGGRSKKNYNLNLRLTQPALLHCQLTIFVLIKRRHDQINDYRLQLIHNHN